MTPVSELKFQVIDGLSRLILYHLNNAAMEQYHPTSAGADEMDNQIADGKKKASELRKIREEFENTITGIL